jgi:YD repeat-containing protein
MSERLKTVLRLLASLLAFAGLVQSLPAGAAPPTLIAQPGVAAPASIPELARALKYDANLIFEFVYNNIDYSPTFGVKKGAFGTLLDGVGNDMDQAALLTALLRQSGYTTTYLYGYLALTPAQTATWLGTDPSNYCIAATLLRQAAVPFTYYPTVPPDCSTAPGYFLIQHTWVSATGGSYGGNTYYFDPSYKQYTGYTGLNLASAMGYAQSSFLTAAKSGSTIGSGTIQNLNAENIASSLLGYTNSLTSQIRTTNPTAAPVDVLGGRYVTPLAQPFSPPTSPQNVIPGSTFTIWTGDIPDPYRTTLQIQIGGINRTFFGDEIYGHRVSIVYNAGSQPQLFLDGVALGTGSAGATTISYAATFPFCWATTGTPSTACGSGYTNVFTTQNIVQAGPGYTYAIVNGWDGTGRGMVEFHRRQLQANTAVGASASSESVLGEALNMVGYAWLAQVQGSLKLLDRIVGSKGVVHCWFGVVGQAQGPYIDMPGGFGGWGSLTSDTNRATTEFYSITTASSGYEWATLNQNLSKVGVSAVSTVKLFDIANAASNVFYDASSSNWSSVSASLSGYASADLTNIYNNYISKGFRVILPQQGNLTQGGWTGVGYLATGTVAGGLNWIGFLISSNLKGGYPDAGVGSGVWVPPASTTSQPVPPPTQVASQEPIDLFTGAYQYDTSDLSIGSSSFPIGLTFGRSYRSNTVSAASPLGPGWTHTFAMSATANSDGLKGLAQDSPIDGAAAIAAAYVVQDLMSDPAKPLDKMIVAMLVQKWATDRLIDNTVNVVMGAQAEQFMRLADGSYNPPLGSSSRLSLSGGSYTYRTKDGTTVAFNSAGNIATWQNPSGSTVSFGYDSSTLPRLVSVANTLGRSFTLGYNGSGQLASVTDNASPPRSVTYAYDAAGNLASSTDPMGQATRYAYTSPDGVQPATLLQQIYYPGNPTVPAVTNTYDSLGRIARQSGPAGGVWTYFFAGYRSEEDDAYGTQHVLFYTPRGKVLFEIQDFAALGLVKWPGQIGP